MVEKRQFNVYLPEELIKRIKVAAIEDEHRLSELVSIALEAYLRHREEQR